MPPARTMVILPAVLHYPVLTLLKHLGGGNIRLFYVFISFLLYFNGSVDANPQLLFWLDIVET